MHTIAYIAVCARWIKLRLIVVTKAGAAPLSTFGTEIIERKRRIALRMDAYLQSRAADLGTRSHYTHAFFAPHSDYDRNSNSRLSAETTALRFDPNFRLKRQGYEIRIANDSPTLKRNTARLIERMYASRGLFPYGQGESLDERNITISACTDDDDAVATLTLCIDLGDGLLADTLYREQIDAARQSGGRVCEITRLAMDPEHSSHEMLAGMMQILYVLTRLTYRVTDLYIEVHPRHAGFYRRLLGYRTAGPEKICPRVGAPAILMHLCQHQLDTLVDTHCGRPDDPSRYLYRLFPQRAELEHIQQSLLLKPNQNQRLTSI